MKPVTSFLAVLFLFSFSVKAQTLFTSFEEIMTYASERSIDLKKKEIEFTQAKRLRLASLLGVLDPSGNVRLSYVNNTDLPVTLVPGELVGGEAGTTEEVQFGLQYETTFASELDVKLINPVGWNDLKRSRISIDLTENNKKLTRKELYEQAASLYYNILTLQTQQKSVYRNLSAADTIRQQVDLRFKQGIASQQDVNEATVNYLELQRSGSEIRFLIDQQYLAFKTLCDIPEYEAIRIEETVDREQVAAHPTVLPNHLLINQARLNLRHTSSNMRRNKLEGLPTLSFIAFNSRQQFSGQSGLFNSENGWIPSSYVGLRIRVPMTGARQLRNRIQMKYDHLIAQRNHDQAVLQVTHATQQLISDYEQAISETTINASIFSLKKQTYEKNLLGYTQGVISLDQTLQSFQDMMNAEYTWIASRLGIAIAQAHITINNNIQ